MSLKKSIDNLKFDTRMIDINIKSQSLTEPEYAKHLDKLNDLKANSIEVDLDKSSLDDGL